jgi:DNA polymerase
MKKAYVDFESYFDDEVSVVTQGNDNYIAAGQGAYIVALAVEGEDIHCGTLKEMGPRIEQMAKDPTLEPWAANSNFDEQWAEHYGWTFRNPWQCALDLSAFHQFPRNLKGFVKCTDGHEMDKGQRDAMRGVRYEELPPAEQLAMQEYCAGDIRWMATAIDLVKPMTNIERRIAEYTRHSNRRGVLIDADRVKKDRDAIEEAGFNAQKRIPWREDAKLLSVPALRDWCISQGIPAPLSTAKTDDYMTKLMSDHPALDAVMKDLRLHRKSNTMVEKIDAMLCRVRPDGVLPMDIFYCGAPHTRRWSSRGVNVQNLEKEPIQFGDRSVAPREWFIPRPGKTFLILDYAQAEPRCLNYMAGNFALLEAMKAGFSYYEAYARASRNWAGAPGTIKKELGGKGYTLLKNECLGCGYGMGWLRFISYCAERGVVVTEAEARTVINTFRKNNPLVVKFWRQMDAVIKQAACSKAHAFELETLTGDVLKYFAIRSNKDSYKGYTIKGDFGKQSLQSNLWGGTLVENCCQRMARDLIAEGIVRCEDAGLAVLWNVHDEVVLEVDKDNKEEAKATAIRLMTQEPGWAPGLPLAVDGGFADTYTKLD